MAKYFKNITFLIFLSAIAGYILASLTGDKAWTSSTDLPFFYECILLLKTVFLNSLKMMVAPIIFFSLLGGIINIGEFAKLKSMGLVTISYYLSTTIIAIIIGLTAVFFIHPWKNDNLSSTEQKSRIETQGYIAPKKVINQNDDSVIAIIKGVADKAFVNPFKALSDGNILGIVTAALLLGLALIIVNSNTSPLFQIISDINLVINHIVGWIIKLTPIGIFAIAFDFQLTTNASMLGDIFNFCLLVFFATMIHGILVLPGILWIFTKINPITFFKKAAKPLLIAFSTSSSSATLPISMQTCEEEFGVSEGVSGFVFPLGATMNMDGTALFEGIAAVFLAHLYGIELSSGATFAIFFMSMISSIGAPGMPSASMSGMQIVLLSAGIPLEAIGILIVIDKPLDTFRTAVNVEGDIIGAIITQKRMDLKSA